MKFGKQEGVGFSADVTGVSCVVVIDGMCHAVRLFSTGVIIGLTWTILGFGKHRLVASTGGAPA